jgi:hypothetical protein
MTTLMHLQAKKLGRNVNSKPVSSSLTPTTYSDPLIKLLHSQELNKDKDLSSTLVEYIDDIDDNEMKQWCIDSLTVLRNLEKIEIQLDQWEFHTLDYTIGIDNEGDGDGKDGNSTNSNNLLRGKLAKRVLDKSTSLRAQLSTEKIDIRVSVGRARKVSRNPAKVISDAGTILVELTMRIVKLAKALDEMITVGFSRAKLTIIGTELKSLVTSNQVSIDKEVVKNYKIFVNNLLNQLNTAVQHNDTVGLWESVAIVGDVEKMFESLKQKSAKTSHASTTSASTSVPMAATSSSKRNTDMHFKSPSLHEPSSANGKGETSFQSSANSDFSGNSRNTTDTSITLDSSASVNNYPTETKSISKISAKEIFGDDNDLIRTKISDHIPQLLGAFQKEKSSTIQKEDAGEREHQNEIKISSTSSLKDEVTIGSSINPGISFFKPSILHALYQPKLKEPIYIHKKDMSPQDSAGKVDKSIQGASEPQQKRLTDSEGENPLLMNASLAIRFDQVSQENEAGVKLLEKERDVRNKEFLEGSMTIQKPLNYASPILNKVSANIVGKSPFWSAMNGAGSQGKK